MSVVTKACSKCEVIKPLEEYHRSPKVRDKRRPDCKVCVRLRQQKADKGKPPEKKNTKVPCACGKPKARYALQCQECARPSHNPDSPNWRVGVGGYIVATGIGGKEIRQHRWVMERHLDRGLLPHENVHHKNGVRSDNRLDNLELWSVSQPSGQRVVDKLQWCKWFIAQYEDHHEEEDPKSLSPDPQEG